MACLLYTSYHILLVDEDGNEVPSGTVGEIVIDTTKPHYGLFSGYYRAEELTAESWHDGLYHTGDTAWKDEDGYFWYVGRTDDVIKASGYRIGPFEIESVLMEHPSVLECAAVSYTHLDVYKRQLPSSKENGCFIWRILSMK